MFHFATRHITKAKGFLLYTKCSTNRNVFNLLYTKPGDSSHSTFRSIPTGILTKRFNGTANFHRFTTLSHKTIHRQSPPILSPKHISISCRNFHLSERRTAAPLLPVIGAFLARFSGPISQLLKLLAVFAGRTFRKWWKKLPDHRKQTLKKYFFSRKELIAGILSIFAGSWLFLYYIHLEETPYTKRSRYVGVTPKQVKEIAESQLRQFLENYAENILPVSHPYHKRVYQVTKRLILANLDEIHDDLNWEVNVIESNEMNAFVLPNGQIFVFTGLLRILPEDDSLSIILGHEIAHAVLQHASEQLCFDGFVNLIKVVLLATIWAIIPSDILAFLTLFIQNVIIGLFVNLPYSRTLEEEADRVGLYFAAKACFDIREGPKVWQRFRELEKHQDEPNVEWLSTHPSHEKREETLKTIVPEALALRKMCNCPDLSGSSTTGYDKAKPLTLLSLAGVYNRSQ
ncbi:metalloendopeptidase OMA1, mitochondrial-like [Dendronephthya gigantea]|uniref:metalloendopeptidase OMA1, mitochondrial-like n=1 Tax=Dendronephthya gigantea TaxID=151771 RepID=UPI00106CE59D|nr:metalloendopeptidase OMA1, mitochondrial-like [Dendronephthya gigantea]